MTEPDISPRKPREERNRRSDEMRKAMTIGELARAAGVNVETIRYYQRRGLIPEPAKPAGGHRRYPPEALDQLGFIRGAQQLGFSLEEARELLRIGDGRSCAKARLMAEEKLEVLGTRMRQLAAMRRQLRRHILACRENRGRAPCPFTTALFRTNSAS
jgi:MerR family mercuric resistance operon transcriptional regulator